MRSPIFLTAAILLLLAFAQANNHILRDDGSVDPTDSSDATDIHTPTDAGFVATSAPTADAPTEADLSTSAPHQVSTASGAIPPAALSHLHECAAGNGPLAALAPGCKFVMKGLALGDTVAIALDFQICGSMCAQISLDVGAWFGKPGTIVSLMVAKTDKGIGLKITFTPTLTVNIGSLFKACIPGGFGLGKLGEKLIVSLSLGQLDLGFDELAFNIQPIGVRVSGFVSLFGHKLTYNVLVAKKQALLIFALDVKAAGSIVNSIINGVLGPIAKVVNPFEVVELDFIVSSAKVDLSDYALLSWTGAPAIDKGISLVLQAKFRPDSTNILFKMIQNIMPGSFFVSINYDGSSLTLKLELPDFPFSDSVVLTKVALSVAAEQGPPPSLNFAISASLRVTVPSSSLLFTISASIDIVIPSLTLTLSMEGTWIGAFGIKALAIGDLVGSITVVPAPPFVTALMLGGTITIGSFGGSPDDCITGKMYVNIDIKHPTKNWFCGQVTKLTIGNVMKILFGVTGMPKFLAESRFPNGLLMSYSLFDANTPAGDFIPGGFYFKGGFNIFNLAKCNAEVLLSASRNFFNIEMAPMKLGPFQFTRTKDDIANGPKFVVDITLAPFSFKGDIEAYLNLFLFQGYAKIKVGDNSYDMTLQTTLYMMFDASISVFIQRQPFVAKFSAELKTNKLKDSLLAAIKAFSSLITEGVTKATAAISGAQESVKKAGGELKQKCMNKCGFSCPQLVELQAEADFDQDSMSFIEVKDHNLFDVSEAEYVQAITWADIDTLVNLDESTLVEYGAMNGEFEFAHALNEADITLDANFEAIGQSGSFLEAELDVPMQTANYFMELEEAAMSGDQEAMAMFLEMDQAVHSDARVLGWKKFTKSVSKVGKSIGKVATKVGGSIGKVATKVGGSIGKVASKVGGTIRNVAHKVGGSIVRVASTVGRGIVSAANTVGNLARSAINAIAKGACEISKKACQAGCSAIGVGANIAAGVMELGKLAVSGVGLVLKAIAAAAYKVIDSILSNINIAITVSGGLSAESFEFGFAFKLRLGSINLAFSVNINLKIASLTAIVNMLWLKVKSAIFSKVPGIGKLL